MAKGSWYPQVLSCLLRPILSWSHGTIPVWGLCFEWQRASTARNPLPWQRGWSLQCFPTPTTLQRPPKSWLRVERGKGLQQRGVAQLLLRESEPPWCPLSCQPACQGPSVRAVLRSASVLEPPRSATLSLGSASVPLASMDLPASWVSSVPLPLCGPLPGLPWKAGAEPWPWHRAGSRSSLPAQLLMGPSLLPCWDCLCPQQPGGGLLSCCSSPLGSSLSSGLGLARQVLSCSLAQPGPAHRREALPSHPASQ